MQLTLIRYYSDAQISLGALFGPSGVICHTLELPWRSNSRSVSCIPRGSFPFVSYVSRRHGSTFLVDVPGRTGILFHAGNTVSDSRGCILTVSDVVGWKGLRSREAFDRLKATLTGFTSGTLLVK